VDLYGPRMAIIIPESNKSVTFAQLQSLINRYSSGLIDLGIKKGMKTIIMLRPGPEFLAVVFALLRIGAVPVMIDPAMGTRKMAVALNCVKAEAFIGISRAHLLRLFYPSCFKEVKIKITHGRRWFWGGEKLRDVGKVKGRLQTNNDDRPFVYNETAAIFFTSGSTGVPKGVEYTHRMFLAQIDLMSSHYQFGKGAKDLTTFPLFSLFDAALGVTSVLPSMDFSHPGSADPKKIIDAVSRYGTTHMFASPAILRILTGYAGKIGDRLKTLRIVITGGAPVDIPLLRNVGNILPTEARIHVTYGATEALPMTDVIASDIPQDQEEVTSKGGGICVGRPLPGVDMKIIRITDTAIDQWNDDLELPMGETGEIIVKGRLVSESYFKMPKINSLSKIPCHNGSRWHRTGDMGWIDNYGFLWICGRKSQRVITNETTLFTVACEGIFNRHPMVARTALVGANRGERTIPVLYVETKGRTDKKKIIAELMELGDVHEHTKNINKFEFIKRFPMDVRHNSKINREKLASRLKRFK